MKLAWLTYGFALIGTLPIALSSPVASSVTAEGTLNDRGMEIDALTASATTGSSGPPLPTCGTFLEQIQYGPVSVWEFVADHCKSKDPNKPYIEQHAVKIKKIHQNGSIWECPRYSVGNARCGAYETITCPDNTCIE